jgi:hypothetical protein
MKPNRMLAGIQSNPQRITQKPTVYPQSTLKKSSKLLRPRKNLTGTRKTRLLVNPKQKHILEKILTTTRGGHLDGISGSIIPHGTERL